MMALVMERQAVILLVAAVLLIVALMGAAVSLDFRAKPMSGREQSPEPESPMVPGATRVPAGGVAAEEDGPARRSRSSSAGGSARDEDGLRADPGEVREADFVGTWHYATRTGDDRRVDLLVTMYAHGGYASEATIGDGAAVRTAGVWRLEGDAVLLDRTESSAPRLAPEGRMEAYWESRFDDEGSWCFVDDAGLPRRFAPASSVLAVE